MAVQYDLSYYYRQNEGAQELSPTLQSSELWTPQQVPQRPTTSPERYHEYLSSTPVILRLPWGREREYGGVGAVSLPADHRPKTEPPPQEAKGHKHYGYGGDPWPRGLPIEQFYHLTKLKKSAVRASDDLYPKPPDASISDKQICEDFPAEHPYYSHISKYAVFPNFTPSEEPSRCPTPLHPQTPASGYPTVVLRKTKGNPYRHEIVTITSDAPKLPLTWPGQRGYYHLPKFHNENVQIYYPIPPKTVAPNTLHKSYEETLSERTRNLQRNLMRSQWITSYNRSFTGNGEMNPLKLDDFHDKVIGIITGRTDENTEMKPTFLSTILHAQPLEGRIARLQDGRRPLVKEEECIDRETETANSAIHSDKKYFADSQSLYIYDAFPNNLDACKTTEKVHSQPMHVKWQHKERDMHKITDTEQSEALYQRQLTLMPNVLESKPTYIGKHQPIRQAQYLGFESPYSLSKHVQKNCPSTITNYEKTQNNQSVSHCNNLNNHGRTLPRPSLQELQDSFSKSRAHEAFHKLFPENTQDLRENYNSRKRNTFYGFHSFYFHN
ncbi:sperm-associated microtubule inner protein 4 isoform X2 [Eleutherodactylus coqui]|uniref:sperm-associated microtubule inner protein 4 isoform X2 n=1 Tax=Eleutherodactylus coqui TaxID=57060 RepID=UPI0034637737